MAFPISVESSFFFQLFRPNILVSSLTPFFSWPAFNLLKKKSHCFLPYMLSLLFFSQHSPSLITDTRVFFSFCFYPYSFTLSLLQKLHKTLKKYFLNIYQFSKKVTMREISICKVLQRPAGLCVVWLYVCVLYGSLPHSHHLTTLAFSWSLNIRHILP